MKCCTILRIDKASEVPVKPINGKPTLVYWDIVGIVHPIRMALALACAVDNEEWYDVRMICGSSRDMTANKKEWYQAKKCLQKERVLDFPNLPFFLDEDVALTQSDAILRYVSKRYCRDGCFGGNPSSPPPSHVVDMLSEEAKELDSTMVRLSYEQGAQAVTKWLCSDELRDSLKVWEGYIRDTAGGGGGFVTNGTSITLVDLHLYTFLYKFQHAQASLMVSSVGVDRNAQVPALPFWVPAYLERVKKVTPQLQAYLDSPDMKIPINNPHACFDNY